RFETENILRRNGHRQDRYCPLARVHASFSYKLCSRPAYGLIKRFQLRQIFVKRACESSREVSVNVSLHAEDSGNLQLSKGVGNGPCLLSNIFSGGVFGVRATGVNEDESREPTPRLEVNFDLIRF